MQEDLSRRRCANSGRGLDCCAFLIALMLFAIGSAPAWADGPEATRAVPAVLAQSGPEFAQATGVAEPTYAWAGFCDRIPEECSVDPAEPAVIPLTIDVLALLREVTEQVNSAIIPMTDQAHWGVEDRWDYPDDGYGDCEDIQLLKRRRLIDKGLPRRALRMTVVLDQEGEGHAVLMAHTTSGDLILDNKTSAVLPWRETGYRFLKREGQDGRDWSRLLDQPSPAAVASH
jgi:predicted transglutaminase-like cysteine proteinase